MLVFWALTVMSVVANKDIGFANITLVWMVAQLRK